MPVITKIEQQKENSSRASIYIDHSFAFGLDWLQVSDFRLSSGMEITPELTLQLNQSQALSKAKFIALRYLERRSRTEKEMEKYLVGKEVSDSVIQLVLVDLKQSQLLDDTRYTKRFIESKNQSSGYGPQRLKMGLIQKGVPKELIQDILSEVSETELLEEVKQKAQRKWVQLAKEKDPRKRKQKLYAFLQRKGFGFSSIQKLTDQIIREESENE